MDDVCELKTAESVAAAIGVKQKTLCNDLSEPAEDVGELKSCVYRRQRSRELLRAQSASDE